MLELEFIPFAFLWHLSTSALFMLCIISAIINYYSKEKSFGYYALYSFVLLIFLSFKAPYEIPIRDFMYESRFAGLNWYIQVVYNSIYFLFFIYFLDLKKHYNKFSGFVKKVVGGVFIFSTIIFVASILWDTALLFQQYFMFVFTPIMFCFAVYTIGWTFKIPGKLKYFIIFGGATYISLAVVALINTINYDSSQLFKPLFYFYIGIFIEQFCFALGLAYKVRMINKKLLFQLTENEKIKSNQNQILEKELKRKEQELLQITKQAEEERISKLKSEFENEIFQLHLSSLQSQMNPHFIFNALNSIKVFLIENNKEQAVYFLNKFAKLIRKILDSSRFNHVSLREELEMINLYMGIENMRFDNQIDFFVNVDEQVNLESIKVPPLVLQPFVENSLWHGLMLSGGNKNIQIKVYIENAIPMLSVTDNGIGRAKSKKLKSRKTFKKKSLGLKMTLERIDYFNRREGLNYYFEVLDLKDQDGNPCGTEVKFVFK